MKKTIRELNLKDKKVLIRVDFNVPIKEGVITSNKRIIAALPTIKFALEAGAKVILLSHLGRVKTLEDKNKKTLRPIAEELTKQLRKHVEFVPFTRGRILESKIKDMKSGDIILMENTRFEDLNNSAESKNSPELGKYWASLGDIFINDAFGTVHRSHASNVGISKNVSQSAIGFLVQEELSMLAKAIYGSKRPFIAIIGGAKITDKIQVIDNLINKIDYLIIGGGMAYTFYEAQGLSIGSSLVEMDKVSLAKDYLKKYSDKIILPIDSAISKTFSNTPPLFNEENPLEIPEGYMGLDIGPKTINLFKSVLAGAKTVIWNGPMGVSEFAYYNRGTEAIANIIAAQPDVFSIIGGGDSAAAIINLGLEDKFTHISTGGGASLKFLEGAPLYGVDAIQDSNNKPGQPIKSTNFANTTPIKATVTPVPANANSISNPNNKPVQSTNNKSGQPLVKSVNPVTKPITEPANGTKIVPPSSSPQKPSVSSNKQTVSEPIKKSFFARLFGGQPKNDSASLAKSTPESKAVVKEAPKTVPTKSDQAKPSLNTNTKTTPVKVEPSTNTKTIPVNVDSGTNTKTIPVKVDLGTNTKTIPVKVDPGTNTKTTPVKIDLGTNTKTTPLIVEDKTQSIRISREPDKK